MRAYVNSFSVPKDGSSPDECEDADAWSPRVAFDQPVAGRVVAVVSDGASESLLARHWARHLTERALSAVEARPAILCGEREFADAAVGIADEWPAWVADYRARRAEAGRPVQWYEEPGLARGDYATLLAVQVDLGGIESEPDGIGEGCWYAAALGDTCVFHVRGDSLLRVFPVESSTDFDTSPALLGSANRDRDLVARHVVLTGGTCQSGDDIYLATDGLAACLLNAWERGSPQWDRLRDLYGKEGDREEFEGWVADARRHGLMRNDDVTLLRICVG